MPTVTDDFSGDLSTWSQLAGTWAIVAGKLRCETDDGATGDYIRKNVDVGSLAMYARATLSSDQTNASSNSGVCVRFVTASLTAVQFVVKPAAGTWELWTINSGTEPGSPLTSGSVASAVGDVLQTEAVGRLYRLKLNGTLITMVRSTTPNVTGPRSGLNGYNNNTLDFIEWDDFAAGPLVELLAPFLAGFSPQVTTATVGSTTLAPAIDTVGEGLVAGDLIIVQVTTRDAAVTVTAPAGEGWELVQNPSQTGLEDHIFAKVWGLGATDNSTPSFTLSDGTAGAGATATVARNPDHDTAPWTSVSAAIVASASQANASSTTVTAPDTAHAGDHRSVLRLYSSADDNALGAPSAGVLAYGGATYDQTSGNDYSQAASVVEDTALAVSTGTATVTETVLGPDISNGITLVLAIPSGGTVVGAVSETDALLATQRTSSKSAGVVAEADVVQPSQHSASRSAVAISESDSLAAVAHQHSVAVGQLSELDALVPATRSHGATTTALAEVDSLAAPARTASHQPGVLAETDELLAAGETSEAGAIAETDTLLPAGHTSILTVGALAEIDTLDPANRTTDRTVGQLSEIDALTTADHATGRGVGLLAETDLLAAAGEVEEVGALAETNVLLPAAHASSRTAGPLAEIDELIAAVEEVLGRVRFVTRSAPIVSATTRAEPTVDMEVST